MRISNHAPVAGDDPHPRVPVPTLRHRDGVHRRGVERGYGGSDGGQDARLVDHRPLLRLEEVPLVGVETQQSGKRKERQQDVERQEADGNPRRRLSQDRPPAATRHHSAPTWLR